MCVTCGCSGDAGGFRIETAHEEEEHVHILPNGARIVHNHKHHMHPLPSGTLGPQSEEEHVHTLPNGTRIVHSHKHHMHPLPSSTLGAQSGLLQSLDGHEHVDLHVHPHHDYHGALRSGHEDDVELIQLQASLLDKNDAIAKSNRQWLAENGIFAINLMSSPGAGKTTLLVRTLSEFGMECQMSVVEGDQETSADADRIRATGVKAVQVNTGAGCHLEADMLARAIDVLAPPADSLLFVENVGNLVCPALFDLGEGARVVVLSCTDGDDKPLKYPHMFRAAELMVLTKIDLLPHVSFDADKAEANARTINPHISCLRLSSCSGEGMAAWYDWLRLRLAKRA